MRSAGDLPEYDTPFYLFGNARHTAARSLAQLVADGFLSPGSARDLIEAASDVSLAIVAPDAAAGKSSLLAALLPFVPHQRRCYHLRGSFETFRFTRSPDWRPGRAVLIANEVSDHLPVYLPHCRLTAALQLVGQGARIWATAHARDLRHLLDCWTGWPAQAPLAVVTVHGARGGIHIELHGAAGRSGAGRAGSAIDSVCHAEGG